MTFCSKCGQKVPEDAYFCPKCGFRTRRGVEAGVGAPTEDVKEALARTEKEIEKAFTTATKEMQKAFKTITENVKEKGFTRQVVCTSCGQQNPTGASFCYKCGNKID